jgi:hypothetical protein
MTITKRIMLSAVTTFALGIGSAMAQSQVSKAAEGAYFSQPETQQQAAPKTSKGFWGPKPKRLPKDTTIDKSK